jgi:hypothetical protein
MGCCVSEQTEYFPNPNYVTLSTVIVDKLEMKLCGENLSITDKNPTKLAEKMSIIKATLFHLKIYIGIAEMYVSLVHIFSTLIINILESNILDFSIYKTTDSMLMIYTRFTQV